MNDLAGCAAAWDVLFLVASSLTACYTIIIRQSKLDAIHLAALVSSGSIVIYALIYFVLHGFHLDAVPLTALAVRVVFLGIAVTIMSLVLCGRAG